MPAGLAAVGCLKDIVFFPVGFRAKRFPGGSVECWTIDPPTTVWQILIIQLAVVEIHRRFQWADRVKALDNLIATGPYHGVVSETNASGISAFQVFTLM